MGQYTRELDISCRYIDTVSFNIENFVTCHIHQMYTPKYHFEEKLRIALKSVKNDHRKFWDKTQYVKYRVLGVFFPSLSAVFAEWFWYM